MLAAYSLHLDLDIVTTVDGSLPTPETAQSIHSVPNRGSVVLFNQASLFQLAELGKPVQDARKAGLATTCDNSVHVQSLPIVH